MSARNPDEAAIEHGAGAAGDADVSGLEHVERDDRRVGQISQFVREEPEALAVARRLSIDVPDCRSRAYSVTAPAIASSRQRFSMRKSSVLTGAFSSTASSVIA